MELRTDRLRLLVVALAVVLVVVAVFERKWAVIGLVALLGVLLVVALVRWTTEPYRDPRYR